MGDGTVLRFETDRFLFCADRMMRWFDHNAPGFDTAGTPVTVEWSTPDIGTPTIGAHLRDLPHYEVRRAGN